MADDAEPKAPDNTAAEIAALKKQLEESGVRAQVLEKTLAALARQQPSQAPSAEGGYAVQAPPIPLAARDRIRQVLQGWSDKDIEEHWKIVGTYFSEMAQPFAVAIGQLADNVDYTRTRLTTKDYDKYEEDIEKEFRDRMAKGKPAARKELYEVVRSRRLPELVKEEAERGIEEYKARAAQGSSAETEGTANAGLSATRPTQVTRTGPLTKESFEKMSLEEKEKALADLPF